MFGLGRNLTLESIQLSLLVFFVWANFFEPNEHFSQNFESLLEVKRAKRKCSDNLGQNILELYGVLVQFRFSTSKTKIDT